MRKRIKTILGATLILLATTMVSAQTPDLFFEIPVSFLNTPDCYLTEVSPSGGSKGFCLMTVNCRKSCNDYETGIGSPPLVYKVSHQGELLGQLILGYEDRYSYVYGTKPDPADPGCFLSIGLVHDNDLHYDRPFMVKFDQDLKLLWRREAELPEAYREGLAFGHMMDSQGRFLCPAYCYDCTSGEYSRYCFRLTPEGELDGLLDLPFQSEHQTVFEYSDGSGDYGLVEYQVQERRMVLCRVNNDLDLVGQQVLPDRFIVMDPTNTYPCMTYIMVPPIHSTCSRDGIAPLADGSLVIGQEATITYQKLEDGAREPDYETYYGLGLLRVSPEGEALGCTMDIAWAEPTDSLVMITPSLPTGDDSFYCVYSITENWGICWMPYFVVSKTDLEGNTIWRRYWNRYLPEFDMTIYHPFDAVLSDDGGCLVTGYSYKYNYYTASPEKFDGNIFLLKFFSDGTMAVPEMESPVRPFAFWPNPSDGWLNLEFSPDVSPTSIEIYDLQGRLALSSNDDMKGVDMGKLPSGVYTLRIVMIDGSVYSEKVMKK